MKRGEILVLVLVLLALYHFRYYVRLGLFAVGDRLGINPSSGARVAVKP